MATTPSQQFEELQVDDHLKLWKLLRKIYGHRPLRERVVVSKTCAPTLSLWICFQESKIVAIAAAARSPRVLATTKGQTVQDQEWA